MTEGQEPAEDFANDRSKAPSSDPLKIHFAAFTLPTSPSCSGRLARRY